MDTNHQFTYRYEQCTYKYIRESKGWNGSINEGEPLMTQGQDFLLVLDTSD